MADISDLPRAQQLAIRAGLREAVAIRLAEVRAEQREAARARAEADGEAARARIAAAGGIGALSPKDYERAKQAAYSRLRRASRL